MDPDEVLRLLRAWATRVINELDGQTRHVMDGEAEAAVAFNDLDKWLSNGGFTPAVWDRRPRSTITNADMVSG